MTALSTITCHLATGSHNLLQLGQCLLLSGRKAPGRHFGFIMTHRSKKTNTNKETSLRIRKKLFAWSTHVFLELASLYHQEDSNQTAYCIRMIESSLLYHSTIHPDTPGPFHSADAFILRHLAGHDRAGRYLATPTNTGRGSAGRDDG